MAAFRQGKYRQSLRLVDKINQNKKLANYASLNLAARCQFNLGEFADAAHQFRRCVPLAPNQNEKYSAQVSFARSLHNLGDFSAALEAMQQSLKYACGEQVAASQLWLSRWQMQRGNFAAVEALAQELIGAPTTRTEARFHLVYVARRRQNKAEALRQLELIAAATNPLTDREHAQLVMEWLGLGESKRAIAHLTGNGSAEAQPGPEIAQILLACARFEAGEDAQIVSALNERKIQCCRGIVDLDWLRHYRARSLDRQGKVGRAAADFVAIAQRQKAASEHLRKHNSVHDFRRLNLNKLPVLTATAKMTPVFFIGFPRSGTTLLDTIVDTQSHIQVISEGGLLGHIQRFFTESLKLQYPTDLMRCPPQQLAAIRELFDDYVRQRVGDVTSQQLVVDKLPLYSIHLPMLICLYPTAKFVFSVRHPMDVCLSNFQQLYHLNHEMARLTTLEDCVTRYCEVMDLVAEYERVLSLNMLYVRYEDLVTNLEREMTRLSAFLDTRFDRSVLEFHQHARDKVIASPSRGQVSQGLYTDAIQKWRRYADLCEPFLQRLSPYIEQFGYAVPHDPAG